MSDSAQPKDLYEKVTAQGDTVRKLKSEKASKEEVDAAVKVWKTARIQNYVSNNKICCFGVIIMPPVSVCHQVSTIGQRWSPMVR